MTAGVGGSGGTGWWSAGTSTTGTLSKWVSITGSSSTNTVFNSISISNNALSMSADRGGKVGAHESFRLALPDGSVFHYDRGKYRIEDKDAKITYAANRSRDFNRFVNASDLVAEFIEFAAKTAGGPDEPPDLLKLPIDLFIAFLIVRASEQDQEVPPDAAAAKLGSGIPMALLPPPAPKPTRGRCGYCGRFVRDRLRDAGVLACSSAHAQRVAELAGGW